MGGRGPRSQVCYSPYLAPLPIHGVIAIQVGPIAHYYQVEILRDLIRDAIVVGQRPTGDFTSSTLSIVAAFESSFPDYDPGWLRPWNTYAVPAERKALISRRIAHDCCYQKVDWVSCERNACTGVPPRSEHCTRAIKQEPRSKFQQALTPNYHRGCTYSQDPPRVMVRTYVVSPRPGVQELLKKLRWETLMAVLQEFGTLGEDAEQAS